MNSETPAETTPTLEATNRADLTCHAAIFTIAESQLSLLLTERNEGPFRFQWELPGCTPQPNEELETAAKRACAPLLDAISPLELRQLGAFGEPGRDPRHRAVAIVYWGVFNDSELGEALRDNPTEIRLVPVNEFTSDNFRFAFDHAHIATDAINALHHSLTHTSTATRICKPTFTMRDLQHIYEVVFDTDVSAGNFHRKVLNTPGFVETVDNPPPNPKKKGRPAQYFQATQIVDVSPPFEFKNPRQIVPN